MKVKVTNEQIIKSKRSIYNLYWRWENWLQKVFIPYARIPVFIVLGFLFLAAGDYIYYGNQKDISALPKPVQERYNSLIVQHGEAFKNRWQLEAQGKEKYLQTRSEISSELQKIHDEAPYASWGRGVINSIKETLWGIKPKN